DAGGALYVRVDRTRKLPATALLRALGYETEGQLFDLLGDNGVVRATLEKDGTRSRKDALIEIYKRLRPGEPPTEDSARSLLESLFFDPRRYDLAAVGRYKLNKKLSIRHRLVGTTAVDPIADPETGEVLVDAGQRITRQLAQQVTQAGVRAARVANSDGQELVVLGNGAPGT